MGVCCVYLPARPERVLFSPSALWAELHNQSVRVAAKAILVVMLGILDLEGEDSLYWLMKTSTRAYS